MWLLSIAISKIPRIGYSINWRLLVADYSPWGLKGDLLKEWAYLDPFDMVSPRYDSPQSLWDTTLTTLAAAESLRTGQPVQLADSSESVPYIPRQCGAGGTMVYMDDEEGDGDAD